jgi:hypothetical protein
MPTMESRGGKTCGERPITLVCLRSAFAARRRLPASATSTKKSEGAVASWRPSIFARNAAQLTMLFSRAPGAPTYSLNSSTQRPSLRLLKRCKSPFDHALPVRAEQIRGLEHEQPVVLITGGPSGICAGARRATAPKSRMTGERKCRSLKRI